MSKKDRDEFQRGRESMHSEMESLRALARRAGEALAVAQEAMDERRGYVNCGSPGNCWQEMKYGDSWDEEDGMVAAALSALRAAGLLDEEREG